VSDTYEQELPDEILNAPVKFGLVAQGHIPTIDRMLAEGKDWDSIGKDIGWQPTTAKQHFERYDYARLQTELAGLREAVRNYFAASDAFYQTKTVDDGIERLAERHLKGSKLRELVKDKP